MARDERDRYGIRVSAGASIALTGTVLFSNSNGISFGLQSSVSASILSASVAGIAGAILSLSAGTTQVTSGQAVFSNSNALSFGVNGQTLTMQVQQASYWDNRLPQNNFRMAASSTSHNLLIQRISFGRPIAATRADLIASLTVGGSTAGSFSYSLGLYTMSGSTAGTVSTASIAVTFNSGTNSTAVSIYAGQSGLRWRSIPLGTWNITPGEYLLAFLGSINGPAGTTGTMSITGSAYGSTLTGSVPGNLSSYFAHGRYSLGTNTIPASLHITDIIQTYTISGIVIDIGQPYIQLAGTF